MRSSAALQTNQKKKKETLIFVKVCVILGLSWALGLVAAMIDNPILWEIFIIFNASQGTLIIITFEVNWKKVINVLKQIK